MESKNLFDEHKESQARLAMLAHDIKNPLTVLLSSLNFLQKKLEAQDALTFKREYAPIFELSVREVYRAIRLANNVVDTDRISVGAFSPTFQYTDIAQNISEVISEMQIFTSGKNIKLNYEMKLPPQTLLLCDAGMLERALCNLLSNAVKAVPKEGGIIDVILDADEKNIFLTVKDNGCGINEEDKEKLFESYWHSGSAPRAAAESTGLGLYIARAVAVAHGGDIIVDSKRGEGAAFRITLSRSCTDNKEQGLLKNSGFEYKYVSTGFTVRTEMSDLI
ncbi:MAG: HAMP domain-containing histidine kinase [Ruminococcaceae bacterium]|jgi:signal transduction histidine kinase|nr:HAMP domain-containing histidine kinase [Oscillospiraceae bacterium]